MNPPLTHFERVFVQGLAALWAGSIAVLSLLPADNAITSGIWDKIEHSAAFAVLALLVIVAWPRGGSVPILLGVTMYGGLIEFAQFLSPGRFPDLWDGVANFIGAVISLLLVHLWRAIRPKVYESLGQGPNSE